MLMKYQYGKFYPDLYIHAPHNLVGTNGDVNYNLATLALKNLEQLEDFHSRIWRLQQEIILSIETVYHTRLLFQYTKSLSNSNKIKAFIAPKMTDTVKLPENNGKPAVYTGVNINGLYSYLEMVGSPTKFTTSCQWSHNFGPSYYTNNDTLTHQPVIAALRMR